MKSTCSMVIVFTSPFVKYLDSACIDRVYATELDGIEQGRWGNQHVSFLQFKREVVEKTTLYLNEIKKDCTDAVLIEKLETAIAELDTV